MVPAQRLTSLDLSETLSFLSELVYGPGAGFVTGFLITLLPDLGNPYGAGVWTPYIASIIGLLPIIICYLTRHYLKAFFRK